MILQIFLILTVLAVIAWVMIRVFLVAPDYSRFDEPQHDLHHDLENVSAENSDAMRFIDAMQDKLRAEPKHRRIVVLRKIFDEGFTGSPMQAGQLGVDIEAVDVNGVDGEWVVAPGASPDRRCSLKIRSSPCESGVTSTSARRSRLASSSVFSVSLRMGALSQLLDKHADTPAARQPDAPCGLIVHAELQQLGRAAGDDVLRAR